jgi:hypothetical protein
MTKQIRTFPKTFVAKKSVTAGVGRGIILRWIFSKWDVGAWTGLIWLRIGIGGGHL